MATAQAPAESSKVNWADVGFKILSLLILPLLGIGVSMYTDLSVMRERVSQIQTQQTESRTQIEAVNNRINQIAMTVQETNGQIRQLSTVLDIIRTQISTTRQGGR